MKHVWEYAGGYAYKCEACGNIREYGEDMSFDCDESVKKEKARIVAEAKRDALMMASLRFNGRRTYINSEYVYAVLRDMAAEAMHGVDVDPHADTERAPGGSA